MSKTMILGLEQVKNIFEQAYLHLNKEKELINGLNVFPVPDGDTGTNMGLTMKAAVEAMQRSNPLHVNEAVKMLAKGSLMGARGNSGVILSQILGGFSKGIEHAPQLDLTSFIQGLKQAVETSYKAVVKPVEGTILTVIRETYEGVKDLDVQSMSYEDFLPLMIQIAQQSLDDTPKHLPILKQSGVVDAGGRGLLSIFQGFNHAIRGEVLKMEEQTIDFSAPEYHQELTDIKFQYCTEFIITKIHGNLETLRTRLLSMGDSMVFVQDDELVKCHVHTNHPGEALENALQFGEIFSVKIENMKAQHSDVMEEVKRQHEELEALKKPIGIVAVGAGEGFANIFRDFGVDEIVNGGQTMNPSTEDIVAAIERIHADNFLILPNNSNIILAATQAKELLADKNIAVIETKTIPQGIAALMSYDGDKAFAENVETMQTMKDGVSTLMITYSVRTTKLNGFAIKEGDMIAIMDGKIVAVERTPEKALREGILRHGQDFELITIYTGEQADRNKADRVLSDLAKKLPEVDFEIYEGLQPVYYYIVSME